MAYFTHRPKGPRQLMHVVDHPTQLYKKKNIMTAVQKNKTAVKLVVESGKKKSMIAIALIPVPL